MRTFLRTGLGILVAAGLSSAQALSPTAAGALPLKSSGTAADTGWRLDQNGFVGAYLKTDKPGEVEIRFPVAVGAVEREHGSPPFLVTLK